MKRMVTVRPRRSAWRGRKMTASPDWNDTSPWPCGTVVSNEASKRSEPPPHHECVWSTTGLLNTADAPDDSTRKPCAGVLETDLRLWRGGARRPALIQVGSRRRGRGLGDGRRRRRRRRRQRCRLERWRRQRSQRRAAGGSGAGGGGTTARSRRARGGSSRGVSSRGAAGGGAGGGSIWGCSDVISLTTSVFSASDATSRWPARSGMPAPVSEPRTTMLPDFITTSKRSRFSDQRTSNSVPVTAISWRADLDVPVGARTVDDRKRGVPAIELDGGALARARLDARDAARAHRDRRPIGEARGRRPPPPAFRSRRRAWRSCP